MLMSAVMSRRTIESEPTTCGLVVNNPKVTQYQLWIFDGSCTIYSEGIAVGGGVFDIEDGASQNIMPIRANSRCSLP